MLLDNGERQMGGGLLLALIRRGIVTPWQLHQWNKRATDCRPWCPGTAGTAEHMFLESPSAPTLWGRLDGTFHEIFGTHPLIKRSVLYHYARWTLQCTNHPLFSPPKTTIYGMHMTMHDLSWHLKPLPDVTPVTEIQTVRIVSSQHMDQSGGVQQVLMCKQVLGNTDIGKLMLHDKMWGSDALE
jgi:hypothetical protein